MITAALKRYVFTSANLAYASKVFALAESLKRHEPTAHFVWALVEDETASAPAFPAVDEVLRLESLDEDWEPRLRQRSVVEACTAVKGSILATLLARPDCASVTYLDPDIYVYGKLDPVWDALSGASIILTPHMLAPSRTTPGILDNEVNSLKHGIFNLGFFTVAPDEVGRSFAEWWRVRLWDYCLNRPDLGLFTDQRWIDHVPVFFDRVHVLRHQGCNVASWNLGERDLSERDGTVFVGNDPLVFWHFSSVDNVAHLVMTERYAQNDIPKFISAQYRSVLQRYRFYDSHERWTLGNTSRIRWRTWNARAFGFRVFERLRTGPLGPLVRSVVPPTVRDRVRRRLTGTGPESDVPAGGS
jgi:hypothetical protein